jgi:lysophospholipase L1-like esterase
VAITLGLNDNAIFAAAAAAIHTRIGADFTRLKHALPHARFIVVEPFWYTDDRPPSVDIIGGGGKAAAAEIHADYIPGASHWIEHHPEWMASDGLHPNDDGYAAIAKRMDAALTGLGLSRFIVAKAAGAPRTMPPGSQTTPFTGASCWVGGSVRTT